MLKALSLALLLALASPALAKEAPAKSPAPKSECISPDEVIKQLGENRLLKRLNDAENMVFAKKSGLVGDEASFVLFRKDKTDVVIVFVRFVKGCLVGYGAFPGKLYPSVLEDGSL